MAQWSQFREAGQGMDGGTGADGPNSVAGTEARGSACRMINEAAQRCGRPRLPNGAQGCNPLGGGGRSTLRSSLRPAWFSDPGFNHPGGKPKGRRERRERGGSKRYSAVSPVRVTLISRRLWRSGMEPTMPSQGQRGAFSCCARAADRQRTAGPAPVAGIIGVAEAFGSKARKLQGRWSKVIGTPVQTAGRPFRKTGKSRPAPGETARAGKERRGRKSADRFAGHGHAGFLAPWKASYGKTIMDSSGWLIRQVCGQDSVFWTVSR